MAACCPVRLQDVGSVATLNGVTEYCDFVFGLMDMGDPDMLDYACNHTILFNGVISSQRNRYTYGQGKVAGSTEQSATTGAE